MQTNPSLPQHNTGDTLLNPSCSNTLHQPPDDYPDEGAYQAMSERNTMALRCHAQRYIAVTDTAQILPLFNQLQTTQQPYVIVSGGSNIILPPRLAAWVISPCLLGQHILAETAQYIDIEVMAGENWHDFVTTSVTQGRYGLENLALIPGWVGASPVQNIGAYGVQVEDCILQVNTLHLPSLQWHTLSRTACQFSYRDSLFKQQAGEWLITSVVFRLQKTPNLVLQYGDVARVAQQFALQRQTTTNNSSTAVPITPSDIMHAIIQIRQSKLPDPQQLANCGSFFKNPIVSKTVADRLLEQFPTMIHYPTASPDRMKLAAGWLIEQAGLKGQGVPPILTHTKQALVLTNHAPAIATQADIQRAIDFIQHAIKQHFGIVLEPEPVWIMQNGQIGKPAQSA